MLSSYLVFGDSGDVTREISIYDSKLGILEKGRPGKFSIKQLQIGEAGEIFRFLRASLILVDVEFCKWRTFFRKVKENERERERGREKRKVDQANASPSFNEWNAVFRRYIFFQPTVADESFQPSGNCDSADFAVALPSTLPPFRPPEAYENRHRSDRDGKILLRLSSSRETSFSKNDKRCNDKLQPMRLLLRSISVIKLRYKISNHRRTVIFLPRGHVRGSPLKICNAIFPLSSERMKGDSRKLLNLKLFFFADKTSVIFSETISLEYRER